MTLGGVLQGLAAAMAVGAADPIPSAPADPSAAKPTCDAIIASTDDKPACAAESAVQGAIEGGAVEGVVVEGAPRGKTEGPVKPELVLDEAAISTYGAGALVELLDAIAPLTQSASGEPPATLLNGQHMASSSERGAIPPEAVKTVEIYPEQKALAYGFRANQKVVNVVLKPNFRSRTVQSDARRATEGGSVMTEHQATLFRVTPMARSTITVRYRRESPLYEQERDIFRTTTGAPFDRQGNVVAAAPNGELDPALSALVGAPVGKAAVPQLDGRAPSLADFVGGAGRTADDDLTAARTLVSRNETGAIQGVHSRAFGAVTAAFVGLVESTSQLGFQGLPGASLSLKAASPFSPFANDVSLHRYFDVPDALRRKSDTDKLELGATALGMWAGWRWTLAGNFDLNDTAVRTGRGLDTKAFRDAVAAGAPGVDPFGQIPRDLLRYGAIDTADSVTTNAKAELTLAGTVMDLPAGRLRATVKSGIDSRKVDSVSVRSNVREARILTRDRATLQTSVDAPIVARDGPLGFLGGVTLNGNLLYEQFSDIGGLITAGGGVNWAPARGLVLSANYSVEEGEPTPAQLNDPVVRTPNVTMYDFATGETVIVSRISGGNPNLAPDNRQVVRLGLNWRPFEKGDLVMFANYMASRVDDQIASFPDISPELEAALPRRFTRDAAGVLTAVDIRPINVAHADKQELRWGLFYNRRWGAAAKPTAQAAGRSASGPGQAVLSVSLNHLWRLQDELVIGEGMAPLDLLDGASAGRRTGTPRHELTLQANLAQNGMGCSLRGSWRSATWIDGGFDRDDIHFTDLPTLNVGAFLDLSSRKALVERHDWAKGARVTFAIDNLFDDKQSGRDDDGRTPQAYQPDFMDPMGRTVRIGLRKML